MKKLFAMLMALTILMTMAACGQQTTDEAGGTVDPGAVEDQGTSCLVFTSKMSGCVGSARNARDLVLEDFPDARIEVIDSAAATVTESTMVENAVAMRDAGCTLDETWTFYTEAQIAEINGFLTEGTSDEDMRQLMEENQSVYDMYASSTDGLMTMNVVFQNMGLLFGTTMSAQDYVELSAEQLPDAMGTYGFEDVTASVTTAEFAGAECPAIAITATVQDTPMYELLVCMKEGNYIYCVTGCGRVDLSVSRHFFYHIIIILRIQGKKYLRTNREMAGCLV